jgi:hypothetical protein
MSWSNHSKNIKEMFYNDTETHRILTTGLDSFNTTHSTVFLVHVVGTGTRIVTDPDTEVLDLFRTLLGNLLEK